MTTEYFFDTFAVMEILKGNINYNLYLNSKIILTKLNLFEIYSNILRDSGKEEAEKIFDKYKSHTVEYDDNVIKEASELWVKYRNRNISMTDCIGYVLAKKLRVNFLTGDEQFKDLDNVEFVK